MSTDESTASNKKSLLRKVLFKLLFWRKAKEPTIRDTIEELIEEEKQALRDMRDGKLQEYDNLEEAFKSLGI